MQPYLLAYASLDRVLKKIKGTVAAIIYLEKQKDEKVKSMLTQIAQQIEARGMQQGMQQKAKENALKMKEKGYSVEDIVDITGLTVEEIQNL